MGDNIILIGMPGSGKTTVAQEISRISGHPWIDTDHVIEEREGCSLQTIVDTRGYLALRRIEAEVCLALDCQQTCVATGGSVVYSEPAIAHLRTLGPLIWLETPFAELETRINNFSTRGLARPPGHRLIDLYTERSPLYRRHADHRVSWQGRSVRELAQAVLDLVQGG